MQSSFVFIFTFAPPSPSLLSFSSSSPLSGMADRLHGVPLPRGSPSLVTLNPLDLVVNDIGVGHPALVELSPEMKAVLVAIGVPTQPQGTIGLPLWLTSCSENVGNEVRISAAKPRILVSQRKSETPAQPRRLLSEDQGRILEIREMEKVWVELSIVRNEDWGIIMAAITRQPLLLAVKRQLLRVHSIVRGTFLSLLFCLLFSHGFPWCPACFLLFGTH